MSALILVLHLVTTVPGAVPGTVPGTVEGRVLSAASDRPVPAARVTLVDLERSVRTDAEGRFVLSDLAEGRWQVRIEAPGYVERDMVLRVPAEGTVRVEVELRPLPGPAPEPEAPSVTVRGEVLEEESGRAVPEARVALAEAGARSVTDRGGRFLLRDVPPGDWTLTVEANGYRTLRRPLTVGPGDVAGVELRLEPQPVPLPGLRVFRGRIEDLARIDAPSARFVDSTRVDLIPVAVERDVFRALQTLPSVTPSSDYSSALWVRGGTPDQTRIHLDGIPLHNPYHVGGFFSTFTAEATEAGVLRPGGLPASAPSSLSGMVEMYTRTPGRDSLRTRGGLGVLSSSATVDGPLAGGRGGWLLSGRRTYLDLASRGVAAVGLIDDPIPYGFSDLLGRVEYDLGDALEVSSTAYLNREALDDVDSSLGGRNEATWGSDALGVRLRGRIGDRAAWDVGGSTSGFRGDFFRTDVSFEGTATDTSVVAPSLRTWSADASIRLDAGGHLLQAGVRWERNEADHDFRPDESDDLVSGFRAMGEWGSTALFLRDRWSTGEWTLDLGVRGEGLRERKWEILPRGRLERELGSGWSLAVAAGSYVQDWWGLRNQEGVASDAVGYELTIPVPHDRPLSGGWDLVLEARGRVGGIDLRADAFRKELEHVPSPLPVADPVEAPLLLHPDSVPVGGATVRGLELSAEGRVGRTALALSYRFQDEERRVGGRSFTPRSERPHRISLGGTHPWGEREVAFALTFMSGTPYTPVRAVLPAVLGVDTSGRPLRRGPIGSRLVLGEANSARIRPYLRLDLSARGAWDMTLFGRRGAIEPYVSVLNVFNRHNAFFVDHQIEGGTTVVRELGPQFPVLPSFGLRWRF